MLVEPRAVLKKKRRRWPWFVLGFLIGLLGWELIAGDRQPFQQTSDIGTIQPSDAEAEPDFKREEGKTQITHKFSPNKVNEITFDADADGRVEQWNVIFRAGEAEETVLTFLDDDKDGEPEGYLLTVGAPGHEQVTYAYSSLPNDGTHSYQTFALATLPEVKRLCAYMDMDRDGKVDVVSREQLTDSNEYQTIEASVVYQGRLLPIYPDELTTRTDCSVKLQDGTLARMRFDNHAWRLEEPP